MQRRSPVSGTAACRGETPDGSDRDHFFQEVSFNASKENGRLWRPFLFIRLFTLVARARVLISSCFERRQKA